MAGYLSFRPKANSSGGSELAPLGSSFTRETHPIARPEQLVLRVLNLVSALDNSTSDALCFCSRDEFMQLERNAESLKDNQSRGYKIRLTDAQRRWAEHAIAEVM